MKGKHNPKLSGLISRLCAMRDRHIAASRLLKVHLHDPIQLEIQRYLDREITQLQAEIKEVRDADRSQA